MRKVFLLLTAVLLLINGFSQDYTKGFKFLNQHKYSKAKRIFEKALKSNLRADIIVGYFGLSRVYADSNSNYFDLKQAFDYYQKSYKYYQGARYAILKYLNNVYHINPRTYDSLSYVVLLPQYEQALKSHDIQKIKQFIYNYEGTPLAQKLQRYVDSVDFEQARNENTIYSYRKFIQDHPKSYYIDTAKSLLNVLWQKEFNRVYRSLDLTAIRRFEMKYPDYPYNQDTVMFYKDLAHRAMWLKLYLPFDSTKTMEYINFVKDAAPYEQAYLALLKLAEPPMLKHNWQAAADTILKYKKLFPHNTRLDSLVAILQRKERPLKVEPLKGDVNTPDGLEFLPVVTVDDTTMYFCGEGRDDNLGKEDIYVTHFNGKIWTKPKIVEDLSSLWSNEAVLSATADGNSLVIFKDGDIYMTHKTKYGWSDPEPIEEINTDYWDADAFITADGNAIIFASDRPNPSGDYHPFNSYYHGGFNGNIDLWVVVKKNGHWSKPINLGQVINTPYAERSPFLHPDMKTLYFLSDGHTTLGSMDVLVSHRLSDTSWTQWSKPVNLGKYINTPNKEFGYYVSAKGDIAYYSRVVNNQMDIYTIEIPKKLRPKIILRIIGHVRTPNGQPLAAKIIWEDLEKDSTLGQLQTDPNNGYYVIALPQGKNYGFYISAQGYYPISSNVDLRNYKGPTTIERNFVLYPIKQIINDQISIRLNNIFFDFNSAKLRPESYPELNRFARFLKQHPDLLVEISGHTDSIGTKQYNQKLSERRAQAVKQYLISQGCNPRQLVVKGYGFSRPVSSNQTEEGRQKNRRVEFKVIGKLEKN